MKNLKIMKGEFFMKKQISKAFLIVLGFSLYAQASGTSSSDKVEEIELPDVTTVVDGKSFTAGKDSVPDYSAILPENSAPTVELPQMEGVKTPKNLPENKNRSDKKEKDIYAEGELGAGYPFYFKGDFSIYRASGASPFEVNFNHESSEGFSHEKSNEGYFSRETSVKGKKSLYGETGKHRAQAEYTMSDDGLQLKSDAYSDMVKHTIRADAGSDWELDNGILISYGAEGAWFNRYGEIMKDSAKNGNFLDSTKILDMNPYLGFGWQGEEFRAKLTGFYTLQANLGGKDNLLEAEDSSSSERTHRGEFTLDLSWEHDFITLGADGSVIIGNAIGDNAALPAFTGRIDLKFDSLFDNRFITIEGRGGLASYQEKLRDLENKYKFSVCPALPSETSDWFGKLNLVFPILTSFEAKTGFEFKKTAFDNGVWEALYTDDGVNQAGVYSVTTKKRTEFNTNLGLFADFSPFKAGVEWKSFWKDVPSLEDGQKIRLSFEYQSLDAKWNAGVSGTEALGENADKCPDISGFMGVRLAPALSLAFEVNDVIKLCHGTKRDYAHSAFITTSGNAVLLVKFQF